VLTCRLRASAEPIRSSRVPAHPHRSRTGWRRPIVPSRASPAQRRRSDPAPMHHSQRDDSTSTHWHHRRRCSTDNSRPHPRRPATRDQLQRCARQHAQGHRRLPPVTSTSPACHPVRMPACGRRRADTPSRSNHLVALRRRSATVQHQLQARRVPIARVPLQRASARCAVRESAPADQSASQRRTG
jgi:hypothetical protein